MGAKHDRLNRVLFTLIALLLLAAGVLGLLTWAGVFGQRASNADLAPSWLDRFLTSNADWFWPAVAVGTVLLGVLGLLWAIAQLRSDRVGELEVSGDRASGETVLAGRALVDALTDEVESYAGVRSAHGRMLGKPSRPLVLLAVALDARADLGAVRRRIETEGVPHLRQAADRPDLPVRLELSVTPREGRRVA